MDSKMIEKTEAFLKETFAASCWLQKNQADAAYRLEHSYRVANLAKEIAQAEGQNVTCAIIAGLLHDVSYCQEMTSREDWKNHGRRSAAIARPFLENLGLSAAAIQEICYGIAIHVDDEADFAWERNAFSETVGDADNLDRFDAYRIYESLQFQEFSKMSLEEKKSTVASTMQKLSDYSKLQLGTPTATRLWQERIAYYIGFYEKLGAQLENSSEIKA